MEKTYSFYDITKSYIKFTESVNSYSIDCMGSLSIKPNTKTLTKKCGNRVIKKVVKGDGTAAGTLKIYMTRKMYCDIFGLNISGLVTGVKAYGTESTHGHFSFTAIATDEDGKKCFIALPDAVITSAPNIDVENGKEEIEEIELTLESFSDDRGLCLYEAMADEVLPTITEDKWLKSFTPDMVRSATA